MDVEVRDVVDYGRDRNRPRLPRRWVVAAALVLLVVGVLGVWGDRQLRERSYADLADRVLVAQAVAEGTEDPHLAAMRERGLEPPLLEADEELVAAIEAEALRGAARVRDARDHVASHDAVPWHGPITEARDMYVAFLDALAHRLDDYWDRSDTDNVRLLVRAREALVAAAPHEEAAAAVRRALRQE